MGPSGGERIRRIHLPWAVMLLSAIIVFASVPAGSFAALSNKHSPCTFNPLCVCSNGAAEFGSVICDGVPMADIPMELQESRVFKLHLRNNDLYRLPDAKLQGSGLWSLEVSHNHLSEIPSMAFYGLERALWELHLHHNRLTQIPEESISLLKKLTTLNLADNSISEISREDLKPLANSLRKLDLSGNSLTSVPEGIFWDLQRLESLDLSRNNIIQIHSMAFQNGVPVLAEIYLAGNLLGKIPFVSLTHVKNLRVLDLSNNQIEEIQDEFFKGSLKLDKLNIRYNNIQSLPPSSFQNFDTINSTTLEGNPIKVVEDEAFYGTKIKNLVLRDCDIESLSSKSFKGLEKSLESLDLSANDLKEISADVFEDFDFLKRLSLKDNSLSDFSLNATGFRFGINELNLIGEDMEYISSSEYGTMRNLRLVGMSRVSEGESGSLDDSVFENFTPGLEILDLRFSGLRSIEKDAFLSVPSVSDMNLSNNRIKSIHEDAFKGVGQSLKSLKISNALYFTQLPNSAFHSLTELRTLDLSNNHVRSVPLDTFHKMSKLAHLYLQDNEISTFKRGTFHSQANPKLRTLDLSFNKVTSIPYDTFRFPELQHLSLDDNQISKIDAKSFVEMTDLKSLSLEGNLVTELLDETFQNLHSLEFLNLAHNRLAGFNFRAFESVGTLSNLRIDVSYNNLGEDARIKGDENGTILNYPWAEASSNPPGSSSSNIARLDLSFNNYTSLVPGYFYPVKNGLKILNMSYNALERLDGLSGIRQLRILDLSHNKITKIDPGIFIASKKLQMLDLKSNALSDLHSAMFNHHLRLSMLDLSENDLKSIPANLFQRTSLEIFKVSRNKLTEIPVQALNPVQSTLKHLDLSSNLITTISDSQLSQIHLLVSLDLSHNKINTIDKRAFCCLPNLVLLDLSKNPIKTLDPDLFNGIKAHLESLNVANASLTILPKFQFHKLKNLNVSRNQLTFVPLNNLANLTQVSHLDLSYNELTTPPSSAWQSMHHLKELSLEGNPVKKILNDSFVGLNRLQRLDISRIYPEVYQNGAFGTLPNIRYLKLTLGQDTELNLASLLSANHALSHLHIHFGDHTIKDKLKNELQDVLPLRLSKITLEGKTVTEIHPEAFKFLRAKKLELRVFGYEGTDLQEKVFQNLGRVQNISIDLTPLPEYVYKDNKSYSSGKTTLENPSTTNEPGYPRAVYLENIRIGNNQYKCSCDGIGWIEAWMRKWREIHCGQSEDEHARSRQTDACRKILKDFRSARCSGSGERVLDSLKTKLECEVFNGSSSVFNRLSILLVLYASYSVNVLLL